MASFSLKRPVLTVEQGKTTYDIAKGIADLLLSNCSNLSRFETAKDDGTNYDTKLCWRGREEFFIRVYTNGTATTYLTITHKYINSSETLFNQSYSPTSTHYNFQEYFFEIMELGSDFVWIGTTNNQFSSTSGVVLGRAVDRFDGHVVWFCRKTMDWSSDSYMRYTLDTTGQAISLTEATLNTGATQNGLTVAYPIIVYNSGATGPFSGFVDDGDLLYHIYNGTSQLTFNQRYTRFTLSGHEFVSLGSKLCAKLS